MIADDIWMFLFTIILILAMIGAILNQVFAPPPKPIEQKRAERRESFREAGRDVNEFIRGTFGK